MNRENIVRLVQGCTIAIPLAITGWLAIEYFAVFGTLNISYDFSSESSSVSQFTPAGRALDRVENLRNGDTYQMIVGEPVYMEVAVPRSYDSVNVTVEYENEGQDFVEFGIVNNTEPWQVQLLPFENRVIDAAIDEWEAVADGETILLQRENNFDSVEEFRTNLPTDAPIGIYQTGVAPQFVLADYSEQPGELSIDRILRGRHEFVVYAAEGEIIDASFDLTDVNLSFDAEPVTIQVLDSDGAIIYDTHTEDDGIVIASGESTVLGTLNVNLEAPAEGAYRIVVNANSDIMITGIRTAQHKFVVSRNIFLANNEEYFSVLGDISTDAITIYGNMHQLTAVTDHAASIQTLSVGQDTLSIEHTRSPFHWYAPIDERFAELRPITSPLNDVQLGTDGYLSFTEDSFFDPDYGIRTVDEITELEQFDYIVYSNYTPPVEGRLTTSQNSTISLSGVAGDRKELMFVLSAPGLDTEGNSINIHQIDFTFEREPLVSRLRKRL